MARLHWTASLLLLGSSFLQGQLTIENPKHLEISESQIQALFLTTTRVVEKEFQSPGSLENKFRVKLVLGDSHDRFTIDDASGNGTVYLERWNEGKFAVTTMRLAMQHLLEPGRQKKMLEEIMRRAQEIAPVPAARLAKERGPSAVPEIEDTCMASLTNAAVHAINCRPSVLVPRL